MWRLRDLVDDPLHRKKLPQTLRGFLLLIDQIHGKGCDGGFLDLLQRTVPLQVDPCLTFLRKLPEIQLLTPRGSCNGLLLLEHDACVLEYVVCNPTTEQWVAVPACDSPRICEGKSYIYLVFDPAASPHFHLLQFWSHPCDDDEEEEGEEDSDTDDEMEYGTMVRVYSSETGWWTYSQSDWDEQEGWRLRCNIPYYPDDGAFVQGMLHVLLHEDQIVAVDMQGKTRRAIAAPVKTQESGNRLEGHIFQSQGHLHYILLNSDDEQGPKMSAWVLEDYNTEEWVLKHAVCILDLFEVMRSRWDYDLVTIHPDCNVVFLRQPSKQKLISYNMDSKEVSVISISDEYWGMRIVPYLPCFRELLSLTAKS
ncbi:hypothetical protein ACP70R_047100 [Stipagrostis hirtigluma subsp. patula]